jgi:hypothetical protein
VNDVVQPEGTAPATKVTVPANALTGVTTQFEVPATVARVVIDPQATEKSWTVTETVVDLDKPPLVPVTGTENGAMPALQVTDRTAPVNEAVQPEGTAPAAKVTVPANALMGVTETVELPAKVANIVIAGPAIEKSWMVTDTVVDLDKVLGAPPVVPVTGTVNEATPVAQVTDRTAPENEAVQPAGTAPAAKVTVPANALMGVTETVELPTTVARVVIAGPAIEKSCTVTETVVVLDNVFGAVPVVPVTGTLNGATPVAQVTDSTAPVNDVVQPEGTAPATKVTPPENALIGVTATVEMPPTVARVVIWGPATEKSTTWNVIEFDCMF